MYRHARLPTWIDVFAFKLANGATEVLQEVYLGEGPSVLEEPVPKTEGPVLQTCFCCCIVKVNGKNMLPSPLVAAQMQWQNTTSHLILLAPIS